MTNAAAPPADPTRGFAFALSLVAGLTDVTTFVLLGGLFSAHITGNLVVLAADLASGQPVKIAVVLAIPFFIVIAASTAAAVTHFPRVPGWWIAALLSLQCGFIVSAGILSTLARASAQPKSVQAVFTGLLAVAAMAVQNTLLHVLWTHSPSTAVMTGNVVVATVAAARMLVRGRWTGPDRNAWKHTWPLIVGFFAGCFFGALACRLWQDLGWVLPAVVSLAVAVHSLGRRRSLGRFDDR